MLPFSSFQGGQLTKSAEVKWPDQSQCENLLTVSKPKLSHSCCHPQVVISSEAYSYIVALGPRALDVRIVCWTNREHLQLVKQLFLRGHPGPGMTASDFYKGCGNDNSQAVWRGTASLLEECFLVSSGFHIFHVGSSTEQTGVLAMGQHIQELRLVLIPQSPGRTSNPSILRPFPCSLRETSFKQFSLGDGMDPEAWWDLSPTSTLLLPSGSQAGVISYSHFLVAENISRSVWQQLELLQLGEEEDFNHLPKGSRQVAANCPTMNRIFLTKIYQRHDVTVVNAEQSYWALFF